MRRRCLARWLLVLLALGVPQQPAAADDADTWPKLQAKARRLFVPLPVGKMFARNLDQELKLSRRDPYTKSARADLARDRDKIRLQRAQIIEARRARTAVIEALDTSEHEKAPPTLRVAYKRVRADVDLATKQRDALAKALAVDINPGVDPGGVYWQRWVGKEAAGARAVLADEQKLLAAILRACGRRADAAMRTWLRDKAAKDPSPEVRMQMLETLAQGTDPAATVVLRALLAGEREPWARVAILHALSVGKPPEAAAAVRGALTDKAWPVRAAAITALRTLDARDVPEIEALIQALEKAEGRLRLDLRDALVWTTGQTLGIDAIEWRTWWDAHKDEWKRLAKPAPLAAVQSDGVSWCFGVPTTSQRIVFIVNRSASMRTPVKRRAKGDDGKPSPEPRVDTALNVAAWELSQALATLPKGALFTVITMEGEPRVWSKKPKTASKNNRTKAVRFIERLDAEGGANIARALDVALRIGQPKGLADVAFGTEAGIDTIFLIGGSDQTKAVLRRRLRQVTVHAISLRDLAGE